MNRYHIKNPKTNNYPRVLIIAGVHGNELTAMKSAELLVDYFEFCRENGAYIVEDMHFSSLTVLNYVNKYGLIHNKRESGHLENPFDLNRGYNEPEDIRNLIKKEIDKADIIVDIHSSPRIIKALFLVDNGSKFPRQYIQDYCDLPVVVRNSTGGTIKSYAMSLDKLGLTLETNGMEVIDKESVKIAKSAIVELITHADKIWEKYKEESPVSYPEDKLLTYIKSDISGFIDYPSSAPYISSSDTIKVYSIEDKNKFMEYHIPEGSFAVELHERDFINKGEDLIGYMPN